MTMRFLNAKRRRARRLKSWNQVGFDTGGTITDRNHGGARINATRRVFLQKKVQAATFLDSARKGKLSFSTLKFRCGTHVLFFEQPNHSLAYFGHFIMQMAELMSQTLKRMSFWIERGPLRGMFVKF